LVRWILAPKPIRAQARLRVARHSATALKRLACPAIKRTALCSLIIGGVCALVIPITGGAFADASDAAVGDLETVIVKGNGAGLTCTAAAAAAAEHGVLKTLLSKGMGLV
jgi:hypothetical protein